MLRSFSVLWVIALLPAPVFAQSEVVKRVLVPSDVYRIRSVADPQVSPEGTWVAYVLSTVDSAKYKSNSDIGMMSWDGTQSVRLTHTPEGESRPRWSPDGKHLAFASARQATNQVWLLDRRGGEARKVTDVKGELEDYAWSPDGTRMILVIKDPESTDTSSTKTPQPIVIDRVHFKQDGEGYLQDRRTHLYLFTLSPISLDTLTRGRYDESSPAWSPDGSQIVFVSNRTDDPDRNDNSDLWIIESSPGADPRQLTTSKGYDVSPQWSPDGTTIAYLQSTLDEAWSMYDQAILAVVPAAGGRPRLLSKALDRPVSTPRWSKDGSVLGALVADDRERYLAEFDPVSGTVRSSVRGQRSISTINAGPALAWVSLVSTPQLPAEVHAIENGSLRRLTSHHDTLFSRILLASAEPFTSKSSDGTQVSGILYRPANAPVRARLPLIVYLHGGPVGQDEWGFDLNRQMLAAGGYAVAAVNYRGSAGRGLAFCRSIYADWGNKEVVDVLGAVDHLVATGVADPKRLGIGGWSYGGILTNATIAKDRRFVAAVSDAGSALQFSMFGVDQYIVQFENEVGWPWKNPEKYMKLSAPFFEVERIKTPTLFLAGEKDFNVPTIGSEQMYQAFRVLGIPTQLIVYPRQFHSISAPHFQRDRFERYLAWFGKYLKI